MTANDRSLEHEADLSEHRIGAHMVRGSAWMTFSRWVVRSIGLVSTLVLARILAPADFGVIAMAMLVVAFIEVMAESGQGLALVRLRAPTPAHYDAAWTLQILLGLVLSAAIAAAAPFAARFFGDERLEAVVYVLALRALLNGFINTGIAQYRINLQHHKLFRFFVYCKLSSFSICVVSALILQSYWALAIGMVAEKALAVVWSFRMHPYRPRLSWQGIGDIWGFSGWMVLHALATFLSRQIDAFWIGRISTPADLGHYKVAEDMATAPTFALTMPMAYALFPIYAHLSDAGATFRRTALKGIGTVAMVAGLLGAGIALTAGEFVHTVLGPQWAMAAPLVVWHALTGIAMALTNNASAVLQAAGPPRLAAMLSWMSTAFIAASISLAALLVAGGDLEIIAAARTVSVAVVMLVCLAVLKHVLGVTVAAVADVLWRPALAAAVMTLAIHEAAVLMTGWAPVDLLAKAALGGLTYTATLLVAWRLSGCPDSIEADLIQMARRRLARRLAADPAA